MLEYPSVTNMCLRQKDNQKHLSVTEGFFVWAYEVAYGKTILCGKGSGGTGSASKGSGSEETFRFRKGNYH